jgi:hypothetical protein
MYSTDLFIAQISRNNYHFIFGSLFVLLMGFSLAFIPIILYPILKKQNKTLALGYVIFRSALETSTYIAVWVSMLMLLKVGENYTELPYGESQYLKNIVVALFKFRELCSVCTIFVFGIGALLFYSVLYQSKLIPHWLSVWGILAITLHLATGILIMFGLQTTMSDSNTIMNLPIFFTRNGHGNLANSKGN